MRKLIMWNIMSIDGFIAGPGEDISWHGLIWNEEMEKLCDDQNEELGALVFGRKTYEMMAAYWPNETGIVADYMNNRSKIVFSNTLKSADWKNSTLAKGDPAPVINALKCEDGKDAFLFGSADLAGQLVPTGLIDEYRIGIAPITLGGGTSLFKAMPDMLKFKLLRTQVTKKDLVILTYVPETVANERPLEKAAAR